MAESPIPAIQNVFMSCAKLVAKLVAKEVLPTVQRSIPSGVYMLPATALKKSSTYVASTKL